MCRKKNQLEHLPLCRFSARSTNERIQVRNRGDDPCATVTAFIPPLLRSSHIHQSGLPTIEAYLSIRKNNHDASIDAPLVGLWMIAG